MLRQGSITELRQGHLSRDSGYIVVCMAYYPRGVQRIHFDEFRSSLAPDRKLFHEWKAQERIVGHDQAFKESDYEKRFSLGEHGIAELERLSKFAKNKDVFLICQCVRGERCHREMLLLLASKLFSANIEVPKNKYSEFLARTNYRQTVEERNRLVDAP